MLLALLGAVIGGLFALDVRICPFANLFGLPCPGCGLTRATFALLHGDFQRAWAIHPFSWVASPIVAVLGLDAAVAYVRGRGILDRVPHPLARAGSKAAWVLVVGLLALWIARFFGVHGGPVPV